MEITTNVGCKNMCVYCPQTVNVAGYAARTKANPAFEDKGRMMSLDTFKACLDKIPQTTHIFFAGSAEPFLNPECTQMLEYADSRKHRIRVYTTLVGVSEETLDVIRGMDLERLVIHLPSEGDRERYKADAAYMALLEKVYAANIPTIEFMSVGAVQQVVPTVIKVQIRQTPFEGMSDFAGNLKSSLAPHRHLSGPIYCVSDRLYWNVLYPNGDVTLCCEDFGMKHVIGNLLQSDYDALHTSDEFQKIVRGLSDDGIDILCRTCEYARPQERPSPPSMGDTIRRVGRAVKRRLVSIS
jgi:hypothetical protein